MNKLKRSILIVLVVGVTAQINLDIIVSDFKVSLGIIFLGIYFYLNRNLNNVIIGFLSGLLVYLLRIAVSTIVSGHLMESYSAFYPEIFFYTGYAISFTLLMRSKESFRLRNYFLIILASDFIANFIELFIRVNFELVTSRVESLFVILLVAIVRASVVFIALVTFRYYKNVLVQEEHQQRYQNLLWLTSRLKSEMYWAEKSMVNIEKVMAEAYSLYDNISKNESAESWANSAIGIAQDIHEVKKEVNLVVRGVEEVTKTKFSELGLKFSTILTILESSTKNDIHLQDLNIQLSFKTRDDFSCQNHYYLMSILRNLVYNAIDAIDEKGFISIEHYSDSINHVIKVSDNGSGIKENDLDFIFSAGYSTKIDYQTGSVNRGLGLSIVKDLVENYFEGSITIESELERGTIFIVTIKRDRLEAF